MTTWINLQGIMLHGISQTEKDKYCIIVLICRIWKRKKKKNSENGNTHRYREHTDYGMFYKCPVIE